MNFGANAGKTMAVFYNNALPILKISATAFILSALSLGVLFPPLFYGLGRVFLKIQSGEKAGFDVLFSAVDKTLSLFAMFLITALSAAAGIIFIFLPVLILALWMYAVFFAAGENRNIGESLSLSANAVVKNNFFAHLVAALVLCILNAAGAALFAAGLIVTVPLTAGFLAFCFEEIKVSNL